MSLRDQLLAKGLATKKDARKANRDLKKKRKQKQAKREKRNVLEARERDSAQAAQSKKQEERQIARKEREAEREVGEQSLRVKQIIMGNRIAHQGRTIFHFKKSCKRRIGRLEVSEKVAWMLRCGEAAIARYKDNGAEVHAVVSAKAARRVLEIETEAILFFTEDTAGISEADEAFLKPTWESSLHPHRVRHGDAKA